LLVVHLPLQVHQFSNLQTTTAEKKKDLPASKVRKALCKTFAEADIKFDPIQRLTLVVMKKIKLRLLNGFISVVSAATASLDAFLAIV
jgi:hypothetical protein